MWLNKESALFGRRMPKQSLRKQSLCVEIYRMARRLYPRSFWFVEIQNDPNLGLIPSRPFSSHLTHRALDTGKENYKGVSYCNGIVENEFLSWHAYYQPIFFRLVSRLSDGGCAFKGFRFCLRIFMTRFNLQKYGYGHMAEWVEKL